MNFSTYSESSLESHAYHHILRKEPSSSHAAEFLELAKAFRALRDKYDTNHTVCHMLEEYGSGYGNSVIDYINSGLPQYKNGVSLLVEGAFREQNCLGRILFPIVDYNLDEMAKDPDNTEFAFKPESFNLVENQKIIEGSGIPKRLIPTLLLFMTSKNPKELWERAIAGNVKLYSLGDIQNCTSAPAKPEVMGEYIKNCYGKNIPEDVSSTKLVENMTIPLDSVELGLFVDVDGTLFTGGCLNSQLVTKLEAAAAAGIPVTVFSGGEPKTQTEKLADLGLSAKFLPVRRKVDFVGKALECLVDDTAPLLGGFAAKTYVRPTVSGLEELDAYLSASQSPAVEI